MSAANLERSVFTTPDGADIAYRIRRGRDWLVLIHGLGCDASMWDAVVAALPTDLGLVIPEIRGHGDSTLGWRLPSVDHSRAVGRTASGRATRQSTRSGSIVRTTTDPAEAAATTKPAGLTKPARMPRYATT